MKKIGMFFFFCLFCTNIFANPIQEIVVLGDSLSDNGNLYKVFKILPKSPPYFQGRFSNGPTWAENMGDYFYHQYYIDTKNYAYGGATAIIHAPNEKFVSPMLLDEELYHYLDDSLFKDRSKTLFSLWIGANDYLYENNPDLNELTTSVVEKISSAITTLVQQGGKNFLVLNLPDLSVTPYAKENHLTEYLHAVTVMHNHRLADEIEKIKKDFPGIHLVFVDVYAIFNDLLNNPMKYNQRFQKHITNLTQSCWTGGFTKEKLQESIRTELQKKSKSYHDNDMDMNKLTSSIQTSPALLETFKTGKLFGKGIVPCAEADEYIFWDEIHPTATVHEVLANLVIENLTQQKELFS